MFSREVYHAMQRIQAGEPKNHFRIRRPSATMIEDMTVS
jgi:hypothetical protein